MAYETTPVFRVLFIGDGDADARRAARELLRVGLAVTWRHATTEETLKQQLREFEPSIVVAAFEPAGYGGMGALLCSRRLAPDVPFLFIAEAGAEQRLNQALPSGAVDYVLRDNLARLAPAVQRAVAVAAERREHMRQLARIDRLQRLLQLISGINGLVFRIRDRTELLAAACKLAVSGGGYATAVATLGNAAGDVPRPVAWSGIDGVLTESLTSYIAAAAGRPSSVISTTLRTGREFVCNNTAGTSVTGTFDALMLSARLQSVAVLPLKVDAAVVGVLILTAHESEIIDAEELGMLRQMTCSVSFGLQYLQRDTRARFLAHYDAQTGLAKRQLFWDRVQRLVTEGGNHARYAILVMDIERLSIINDTFGRKTGDLLIQQVAERLKRFYPHAEQIAHFHGGTFAMLRPQGRRTNSQIEEFGSRRTDEVFAEPFEIESRSIPVSVKTGFALFPDDGTDATVLLQNAEAALRHARLANERHVHFDSSLRSRGIDEMQLEHQLRFALERNQFELHYQPLVDIRTHRIEGAEALIRWRSPDGGLVAPTTFLPLLESSGMIIRIGEWVIRQAASDCRRWMREGVPPVRIAVNVATAQLRHADFEATITDAVRPWATPSWGLDIEICEGALQTDSREEIAKLERLRERGMRIAIDDFGTGYSSLSRLASLPIDTLKIDRSFVQQMLASPAGAQMVENIIALARNFNMTTVAEGVERQEEFELLWQLGCDVSQGFLHGPAVSAEEFAYLLHQGNVGVQGPSETVRSPVTSR